MATKDIKDKDDPLFDKPRDPIIDPKPTQLPADAPPRMPARAPAQPKIGADTLEDKGGYKGTGLSAAELVEKFGTNPDGSPATELAPDTPNCPVVSPNDYPFDTTVIPSGCAAPLSQECADYYNDLYKPAK
jgi:hypothetical protein